MTRRLAVVLFVALVACSDAYAARIPLGRRAVARSLERRPAPGIANTLRRDLSRDHVTPPSILSRDRIVNRYTMLPRARVEVRRGLTSGTHLTSRVRPGRPLSANSAQKRLGLPNRPEAQEHVLLKRGTSVRFNKALGGKPGVGEITIVKQAPRTVVQSVRRIR
jgi:hypothetical protein